MHPEFLLRLVLAGLCGMLIGLERQNRLKEAGIRTHLLVAVGACLAALVSKYGFFDLMGSDFIKLDPSRVASSIVTGVGFLGAGMISVHRYSVTGLTTAAGMWVTASIGMALGCGMYVTGFLSTALVLLAQVLLHLKFSQRLFPSVTMFSLDLEEDLGGLDSVLEQLAACNVEVVNLELHTLAQSRTEAELLLRLPRSLTPLQLAQELYHLRAVTHLEF